MLELAFATGPGLVFVGIPTCIDAVDRLASPAIEKAAQKSAQIRKEGAAAFKRVLDALPRKPPRP